MFLKKFLIVQSPDLPLCLLANGLPKQTRWAEDQDKDEDGKSKDILVFGSKSTVSKDAQVGRAERFKQTENKTSE